MGAMMRIAQNHLRFKIAHLTNFSIDYTIQYQIHSNMEERIGKMEARQSNRYFFPDACKKKCCWHWHSLKYSGTSRVNYFCRIYTSLKCASTLFFPTCLFFFSTNNLQSHLNLGCSIQWMNIYFQHAIAFDITENLFVLVSIFYVYNNGKLQKTRKSRTNTFGNNDIMHSFEKISILSE